MSPTDEQLKPLIALSSTWLQSLRTQQDGLESIERSTLLVADEGGMGKTYACSIALNWILETKGIPWWLSVHLPSCLIGIRH